MGTYTPRLNLLKPAEDDFYNVTTQQSENWQKIDDEWLKFCLLYTSPSPRD